METKTIEQEFTEFREETTGTLGKDIIRLSSDKPHTSEMFTLFYDVAEQEVIVCGLPDDSDFGDGGDHKFGEWSDGSHILIVNGDFGGTTCWKVDAIIPKKRFIEMAEKLKGDDL